MEIPTQQNHVYTLTCDNACEVYDVDTDRLIHEHHAGEVQSQFTAIGMKVSLTDDTAHITELFNGAPAGNGGGGYIESNLNVGHGAADAVAAVCTLTLGDLGTGGTLTDSNGQSVELDAPHAYATGSVELADAAEAGTITFGTHEAVELPAAPATRATGGMVIVDANKGGTLTIGEWSKAFAAAQGEKASGTFAYVFGAVTVDGTPVTPPADATSVEGWNYAFLAAGVGLVCTDTSPHGETDVSVEAAEPGTAGNSITISVEDYEDVTLSGGTDGRTVAALLAELEADTDFPCTFVHDGEGNVTLTAKVAGTAGNYSMSCTDEGFIWPDTGLVGGQDGRTPQEVVDILNENEDCPAVAVLAHVEAQDAKAVFTPLESYDSSMNYELSILENGEEVNGWIWSAQDGDTVQELLAALNDDSGAIWQNTRDIEATLEDGKVVLRRLGVHGDASNGYVVQPSSVTPFAEGGETPIEGGRDAYDTINLTADEYGVNDTITITGGLFENPQGMSGGHGDYSVAELVAAIESEFSDITPAAGAEEGTITLAATTAGKAANAITYTAAGCFGSGTTRQGSTTRGKDAVEQTAYQINLNGAPLDVEPAPLPTALTPTTAMRNGGVYTVESAYEATTLSLPPNATAEIWVRIGATAFNVRLPDSWVWVNGAASDMTGKTHTTFCIAVRNDGVKVLASIAYSYDTTPAQS